MNQKRKKKTQPKRSGSRVIPLLLGLGGLLLLVFGGIALLGGGTKTQKAAIEVRGGPSLKVDQEQIDLGDVKLGQWVTARFELTNVGDEPLQFTKKPYIEVKEGC